MKRIDWLNDIEIDTVDSSQLLIRTESAVEKLVSLVLNAERTYFRPEQVLVDITLPKEPFFYNENPDPDIHWAGLFRREKVSIVEEKIDYDRQKELSKNRERWLTKMDKILFFMKDMLNSFKLIGVEEVFRVAIEEIEECKKRCFEMINGVEKLLSKKKLFAILVGNYLERKKNIKKLIAWVGRANSETFKMALDKEGLCFAVDLILKSTEEQRALYLSCGRFSEGIPYFANDKEYFREIEKESKRRFFMAHQLCKFYFDMESTLKHAIAFPSMFKTNKKLRRKFKEIIADYPVGMEYAIKQARKENMLLLCDFCSDAIPMPPGGGGSLFVD